MNQEPNDYQVAGTHYQTENKYQLWDLFVDIELNFFLANAVKYIYRCKNKNGLEDLKKAKHYIDKFFSLKEDKQVSLLINKFDEDTVTGLVIDFLNKEAQLSLNQYNLIYHICCIPHTVCEFSTYTHILEHEEKHLNTLFQYLYEELKN